MTLTWRRTALAGLLLAVAATAAHAQRLHGPAHGVARAGHHHHDHHGHLRGGGAGWYWGLGLGIGSGWWSPYPFGAYPSSAYPGYMVLEPAPIPDQMQAAPPPPPPVKPDPAFIGSKGQTAAQTEIDLRECNLWATTQRSAMIDAAVFQHDVLACMEGLGYSVR